MANWRLPVLALLLLHLQLLLTANWRLPVLALLLLHLQLLQLLQLLSSPRRQQQTPLQLQPLKQLQLPNYAPEACQRAMMTHASAAKPHAVGASDQWMRVMRPQHFAMCARIDPVL